MGYQINDVVVLLDGRAGFVTAMTLGSIYGVPDEVTVKCFDGFSSVHSDVALKSYCHLHEFVVGEEVMHVPDGRWGVVVNEDGRRRKSLCCVNFDGGAMRVCVAVSQLVHKRALSISEVDMLRLDSQRPHAGQGSCKKCGGTGKVVLFQLPVKCECQDG